MRKRSIDIQIFRDLDSLTVPECIDNILFLEYLKSKEVNANLRERFAYYIGKLKDRISELKEQEVAALERCLNALP